MKHVDQELGSASKISTLKINEIFYSIQGEGLSSGLPCIFIRTSGCPLRCNYCDTKYAYFDGEMASIEEIIEKIKVYPCKLVEITGGEPMVQPLVPKLLENLVNLGYETMIETSGSYRLNTLPKITKKIVDFKTPSSTEEKKNCYELIQDLDEKDEIKFVIGSKEDFFWMENLIKKYNLEKFQLLVSPVFKGVGYEWLSALILNSTIKLRMQLQIHKYIFPNQDKGV